ncbi:MAPEG family protein [Sphingomonas sp.]|uniref:MAPEG family protein n=1 Tax=Sphingomonas sp. TaxID=28214 RepID=UPI003B3ADC55
MRIELTLLGLTLVLALVQIMIAGSLRTRQYGGKWNRGARDETMPPLDPLPARMLRAQANLFETLPLFIGAVLAAAVAGRLGTKTEIGAWLYFLGRLVYVPLYATGIPVIRTIVWAVATLGLLLVLAGLLIG